MQLDPRKMCERFPKRFLLLAIDVAKGNLTQLLYFVAAGLVILVYFPWPWENANDSQAARTATVLNLAVISVFVIWATMIVRRKWDWVLWTALLVAIGVVVSWASWNHLFDDQDSDNRARNVVLLTGAVITAILAVWRSRVAERQADTAHESLLNERYQKGAEMLGSETLSVRLGGIYALERLAAEHPEQYHIQIMKLFCAFARHPTEDEDYQGKLAEHSVSPHDLPSPREDVIAAIHAIGSRDETRVKIEQSQDFRLNLMGADLSHANIGNANLSGAMLNYANLTNTSISSVILSGASLRSTIMAYAELSNINFTDADAWGVDLSNAKLRWVTMPNSTLDHADLSYAQLSDVNLSGAFVQHADLSSVDIVVSDLSNTYFLHSKLPGAHISKSNLSGAEIKRTNMSGAKIPDTDLSGTRFYGHAREVTSDPVIGLTQAQVDEACADPDNPPKLDGVLDAETGEPLVWHDKSCKDP